MMMTMTHNLAQRPIALLNVRSIRNKGEFIADYVFEHDIDILCLTETWLTPHDDSLVASLTPDGFTFQHLPRQGRRGGGVGIMLKSSFRVDMVKPWRAGSFECLELVFRGPSVPSTLRLFVIYRPPSSGCKATPFRLFLGEFSHLLEHVSIKQTGLIILGIGETCVTHSSKASLRPNQITIVPRLNRLPEIPKRCIT